jgi:superkiller protein 3
MESETIDWEQDLPLDADKAYRSLVRSLRRTDGFALLFVRCSPAQGDQIITDIRADLASKTIEVLELKESIDNLFDHVATLPNRDQINVLFIKGIEYSIFAYEDREKNDINLRSQSSGYGGTWQGVPRVLGNLNLSRERFRDNLKFCFVFLLPEFVLNYFIRRAPDFFDWRSNIYEFPPAKEIFNQESYRLVYLDADYNEYYKLTSTKLTAKLSAVLSYLDENPEPDNEAALWRQKGLIHIAAKEYEEAISSFDKALAIKLSNYETWYNRGISLGNLGRYEEAIASYDHAVKIKPDYKEAWISRGIALGNLGRYEEAIASYDKATTLESKPDYYEVWHNRGIALFKLGRYEEAVTSFDKTLGIKPNNHEAWQSQDLNKYEEVITSFDKTAEIKPNYCELWHNRGIALCKLNRYEEAITSFDKTLGIKPDHHEAWHNRGIALYKLDRYEEAITSYDRAVTINPNKYESWNNRGIVLDDLGRYKEAIASYDRAVAIKPVLQEAWYNREVARANLEKHEREIARANLENYELLMRWFLNPKKLSSSNYSKNSQEISNNFPEKDSKQIEQEILEQKKRNKREILDLFGNKKK